MKKPTISTKVVSALIILTFICSGNVYPLDNKNTLRKPLGDTAKRVEHVLPRLGAIDSSSIDAQGPALASNQDMELLRSAVDQILKGGDAFGNIQALLAKINIDEIPGKLKEQVKYLKNLVDNSIRKSNEIISLLGSSRYTPDEFSREEHYSKQSKMRLSSLAGEINEILSGKITTRAIIALLEPYIEIYTAWSEAIQYKEKGHWNTTVFPSKWFDSMHDELYIPDPNNGGYDKYTLVRRDTLQFYAKIYFNKLVKNLGLSDRLEIEKIEALLKKGITPYKYHGNEYYWVADKNVIEYFQERPHLVQKLSSAQGPADNIYGASAIAVQPIPVATGL